jgi:twitching motility protein PilI
MLIDYFKVELAQSQPLAIALDQTAEVLTLQRSEICPVPGVKPELLGVSNQRGKLLWFVDLSAILQIASPSFQSSRREKITAIVLSSENLKVAGVVANLKGITDLDSRDFQPHPHPCLLGQTRLDDSPLRILDVESVFQTLQLTDTVKTLTTVN